MRSLVSCSVKPNETSVPIKNNHCPHNKSMHSKKMLEMNNFIKISLLLGFVFPIGLQAKDVLLQNDIQNSKTTFAAEDIKVALDAKGHIISDKQDAEVRIILTALDKKETISLFESAGGLLPKEVKAEGFAIRKTSTDNVSAFWVFGADEAGLMYGGLELAEVISLGDLAAIKDDK